MLPDSLDALSLPSLPQAPLGIFLMGTLAKFNCLFFCLNSESVPFTSVSLALSTCNEYFLNV